MEYFFEKIHFHLLKNYILKDPLCDLFNIKEHISPGKYEKDPDSYYKKYILKESEKYKVNLLKKIKELSKLDVPLETGINETKEKIDKGYTLIFQCNLLDKNNIYVKCDLMIKYKLFKKIFPGINNIPFHLLLKNNDYLLINFTYSTLQFKIDLKDVVNDPLIVYKKCGLYAFRNALHDICGIQYKCFLLGKEYLYKKTHLSKKEFICKPELDEYIHNIYMRSIEWIKFLKGNYQKMNIYPKPTHNELYPNMNYKESDWENEKLKLANHIKEITLVWNISYDERCLFLKNGIDCWDNPKLLSELKESKKKDIQLRMIHMNQQKEILLYPRKTVSCDFKKILCSSDNDIYFDVESFLSFDEKQDLFVDFTQEKEPVLGILGLIHKKKFFPFVIDDFSLEDERKLVKNFESFLWDIFRKNNKKINIYHWGHAEYNYFKYIERTYPSITLPDHELIDILDYFRMEPIIVQGVFKFGIKSVGKALYEHGMIKTTWGEHDSGLDSMIRFKDICLNKKKIPLKRYLEIDDIIEYNRIDCQVLYEIVELLREKYY